MSQRSDARAQQRATRLVAEPGRTDQVLALLHAGAMNPYQWVARSVGSRASRVVDVACAGGGLARTLVADGRLVVAVDVAGVDTAGRGAASSSAAGEVCWVRADPRRLPLDDESVDAVTSALGLAVIHPIGEWIAEASRVLRPGGLLCAMTPTNRPLGPGDAALVGKLARIMRTLPRFPSALEASVTQVLAAHGLHKVGDGRENFRFRVSSRQDAERFLEAMCVPTTARARLVAGADFLESQVAGGGELSLPVPMRRVVAIK